MNLLERITRKEKYQPEDLRLKNIEDPDYMSDLDTEDGLLSLEHTRKFVFRDDVPFYEWAEENVPSELLSQYGEWRSSRPSSRGKFRKINDQISSWSEEKDLNRESTSSEDEDEGLSDNTAWTKVRIGIYSVAVFVSLILAVADVVFTVPFALRCVGNPGWTSATNFLMIAMMIFISIAMSLARSVHYELRATVRENNKNGNQQANELLRNGTKIVLAVAFFDFFCDEMSSLQYRYHGAYKFSIFPTDLAAYDVSTIGVLFLVGLLTLLTHPFLVISFAGIRTERMNLRRIRKEKERRMNRGTLQRIDQAHTHSPEPSTSR